MSKTIASPVRMTSVQKIEPFKVFDNLCRAGYVSVWLLTTPDGNILFDTAQEPYVDHVINNIRKVRVDRSPSIHHIEPDISIISAGLRGFRKRLVHASLRPRRLEDDRAGGKPPGPGRRTGASRAGT
jgi:hypothetical protein